MRKLIVIKITAKPIFIQAWLIWFWLILLIGIRNDVAAMTSIKFAMLLPITAPTARSGWFETTALILLASSGYDVPPATITTPIANSETFNFLPKLIEPLIIRSAPKISKLRPINKKIKFTFT